MFKEGRLDLCGGDLPSVQEMKQREREHSPPTVDTKDTSWSMSREGA